MTKIAIIGSRGFSDYDLMVSFLKVWNADWPPTEVISGGAIGADTLAERFAAEYNIPMTVFKPDWDTHGKGAGFIRNRDIVEAADRVFAFWDGKSKGTKHSITIANSMKVDLFVCSYSIPDRNRETQIATIEHLYNDD